MSSWIAGLLSAETAAALAVIAVVLMAYLTTRVHLNSRQNSREHAELREAINSLCEMLASQAGVLARLEESATRQAGVLARLEESAARQGESMARLEESMARLEESAARRAESTDRRFDAIDRRFDAIDRRFDAIDRKLDLLLIHLVKDRSDKDD